MVVDWENIQDPPLCNLYLEPIYIQLKLETSKTQGLANITRGIRKSTHTVVLGP